jgi:hypothetical protein
VLKHTRGSIRDSTAFAGIAEQFGSARDPQGRNVSLRSLLNQKTLDPRDNSLDELGLPNRVNRYEPHSLSQVLSGALYSVMVKIHDRLRAELAATEHQGEYEVSGKALAIGAERFKRMIFRALDYLPPGEVSFADYGRAIIAADQASHPDDPQERAWICEEFVRRHMVPDLEALKVATNFADPDLARIDLPTLVESDWAAYEFANQHRALLGIPPGIHFRVRPRLDVTKLYYHRGGERRRVRECLFKVSWDHKEENLISPLAPSERQITIGTTLAIDWETRMVRALLTSSPATQQQKTDRDQLLLQLLDEGVLQVGPLALGPDGQQFRSAIRAESMEGLMRVRGTGRTLHIAGGI